MKGNIFRRMILPTEDDLGTILLPQMLMKCCIFGSPNESTGEHTVRCALILVLVTVDKGEYSLRRVRVGENDRAIPIHELDRVPVPAPDFCPFRSSIWSRKAFSTPQLTQC
jgi:hypothetical protein